MDTAQTLEIRRVALDSLHLDPANARTHDERNLEAIRGSLQRFGQAEPLIVHGPTGRVIGGNGRLVAMKALGWTHADVVELDISDAQATALGIALNRTAELADWDLAALGRLLDQLRAEDELAGVGFDEGEIDELLAGLETELEGDVDDPGSQEPPERPVTRPGDLWLLGRHRLLCGDSTKPEDLARLMAGETAALLATDPPYLVDYTAGNHPPSSYNRPETANKDWDHYKDPETGLAFFTGWLQAALPHCVREVPVYQWHAHRRQSLVEEAWKAAGLLVHQQIIWVKARAVLTRSHFMWQHEPCFYGWPEGHMPPKGRRPPNNATTVWEVASEQDGIHPTQKAVELFARPIEAHTRPGEIVLEPFSGSGTEIIAAESLSRGCFAMEQAPAFVDVALRRWEKATGSEATLDGDGRTFREIAQERTEDPEPDEVAA